MFFRKIMFIWECDICHEVLNSSFDVMEYEEIPIPMNPPEGWVKYSRPNEYVYLCPTCFMNNKEKGR